MKAYEGKIIIPAPPEAVFRFLSSVSNIPRYLPAIREARLEEDGHVFAVFEHGGEKREVNGYFQVSPETRRIEWGSDGKPDYRGWLEVQAGPPAQNASELTVHLWMEAGAEREPKVGERLEAVLHSIRRMVQEQSGSPEARRVA
jgi:uncharacterized protein YndB with AHSA1/START domain